MVECRAMELTARVPDRFAGMGAALLLVAGAAVMVPCGDLHEVGNVPVFLTGAAIMLVGFFAAAWRADAAALIVVASALLVRAQLLWQAPGGDIFRYVWEGRELAAGVNPYLNAPDSAALAWLRDEWWPPIEHKGVTAIYPPLAEWTFAGLAAVSGSPIFFKVVFACGDAAAGVLLLRRFGAPAALLYLWNPLVIYSFAGGGHYDSLFLLALVAAWCAWDGGAPLRSCAWLGVAVAMKWMALPIVGWALWRVLRERGWRAAALAGPAAAAPLVVSWLAVGAWTGEWTWRLFPPNFTEYARSTELVPRVAAWVWEETRYHNGWFLGPLALAWAAVILRAKTFAGAAEWGLFIALILSPMVHAWYFTWMIPFAVATRNAGTIALTASGFVYFVVYHRLHADPNAGWRFTPIEIAAIWAPFVAGFLWTHLARRRGPSAAASLAGALARFRRDGAQ